MAKLIRFPPELLAEIEAIAQREYRPFTAQIILIVREWLEMRAQKESERAG